jgi:hypothetical protein
LIRVCINKTPKILSNFRASFNCQYRQFKDGNISTSMQPIIFAIHAILFAFCTLT